MKTDIKNLVIGGTSQDAKILRKLFLRERKEPTHVVSRNSSKLEKYSNERHFETSITNFDLISDLLKNFLYENIFIFAAQSSVSKSFEDPDLTFQVNCQLPLSIFQTCLEQCHQGKILVPLSSECFGSSKIPCNADSPFKPISPYGTSKAILRDFGEIYREKGLQIDFPILFNHESSYRANFSVLWKLIKFIDELKQSSDVVLEVGNLDIIRDWSYANEIVSVIYSLSKLNGSHDVCVGSGFSFSIYELIEFMEIIADVKIVSRLVQSDIYIRPNDILSSYCDPSELKKIEIEVPSLSGRRLVFKLLEDYNVI